MSSWRPVLGSANPVSRRMNRMLEAAIPTAPVVVNALLPERTELANMALILSTSEWDAYNDVQSERQVQLQGVRPTQPLIFLLHRKR